LLCFVCSLREFSLCFPKGYIASANNRVTPPGFAKRGFALTNDWDEGSDGYRARRISAMIDGGDGRWVNGSVLPIAPVHDVASMKAIQLDYNSTLFHDLKPLLGALCGGGERADGDGDNAARAPLTRLSVASVAWCVRLAAWDGVASVGSEEATVWARWWLRLRTLGAAESGVAYGSDVMWLQRALLGGGKRGGGGGGGGGDDAACAASGAADCIDFAALQLNNVTMSSGVDADSAPRWGIDVHKARFAHQILGQIPALACFSDRLAPHGGDSYTVNVGHHAHDMQAMEQAAGPSYREIVDWSAVNAQSLFLNPLGQSGDEFSPLYDDLLTAWSEGEYMAMTTALPPRAGGDRIDRTVSSDTSGGQ
jgi:penicillin amidase